MFNSKYGKVLTIFLVIAIIAIIALIGFFVFDKIKGDKMNKDSEAGIEEFNRDHGIADNEKPKEDDNKKDDDNEDLEPIIEPTPDNNQSSNTNTSTSTTGNKKTTYKGFTMLGYIEIPKNNVRIPILEKTTPKSLEVGVGILYPLKPQLNDPGNTVIAGHNYRNQTMFSKNKNLQEGDKIYITDEKGRRVAYTVYKNFEASPEDTSFYDRDTGGIAEITLTTCTQDSSKRTIILARAS